MNPDEIPVRTELPDVPGVSDKLDQLGEPGGQTGSEPDNTTHDLDMETGTRLELHQKLALEIKPIIGQDQTETKNSLNTQTGSSSSSGSGITGAGGDPYVQRVPAQAAQHPPTHATACARSTRWW